MTNDAVSHPPADSTALHYLGLVELSERIAAGDISPAPMSLARTPTLSLPIGFAPDGLPYGFQLADAPFTESMLCRVGQAYESATRWYTRHPVA